MVVEYKEMITGVEKILERMKIEDP